LRLATGSRSDGPAFVGLLKNSIHFCAFVIVHGAFAAFFRAIERILRQLPQFRFGGQPIPKVVAILATSFHINLVSPQFDLFSRWDHYDFFRHGPTSAITGSARPSGRSVDFITGGSTPQYIEYLTNLARLMNAE
jgi:hypothetical protein